MRCPGALTERYELYVGDVAKADEIEDESVDCIITDPPYPVYATPSYTASRLLKVALRPRRC